MDFLNILQPTGNYIQFDEKQLVNALTSEEFRHAAYSGRTIKLNIHIPIEDGGEYKDSLIAQHVVKFSVNDYAYSVEPYKYTYTWKDSKSFKRFENFPPIPSFLIEGVPTYFLTIGQLAGLISRIRTRKAIA